MEQRAKAQTWLAEGLALHAAGHVDAALERYSRVAQAQPDNAQAWRLLGILALEQGENQPARQFIERAIRLDPSDAAALCALGNVLETVGDLSAANAAYAGACTLEPVLVPALLGLMRTAFAAGRVAHAVALVEPLIAPGPADPAILRALGALALQQRDYAGATEVLVAATYLAPHADAFANLGAACVHSGRVKAAIAACQAALELEPAHAQAYNNLGIAHKADGAFSSALAAFKRAAELGSTDAHANLGGLRLLLEDYDGGWPHYGAMSLERRANPLASSLPMWDGTPNSENRLLVWPEQGIGDTIQMVRFLSQTRERVGSVTLACPPGTRDLFGTLAGVDGLIDSGALPERSAFDSWLPTIRLPVVYNVTCDSIAAAPYIAADPVRVDRFRARIEGRRGFRVGLVWSGNPNFAWNGLRSCGLGALEALRDVPGVTWFALQFGAASFETTSLLDVVPLNADVADFADTAAILSLLDLVITVDTSVAHVCGALGRPGWVLLSNSPDWRWRLHGAASPWYPSLRLFRQSAAGDWAPVLAEVSAALRELVQHSQEWVEIRA